MELWFDPFFWPMRLLYFSSYVDVTLAEDLIFEIACFDYGLSLMTPPPFRPADLFFCMNGFWYSVDAAGTFLIGVISCYFEAMVAGLSISSLTFYFCMIFGLIVTEISLLLL